MMKEIKVKYYGRQGAEELYRNIENKRIYVRQPANVPEIVFWLTSCKWQGGYEADCPIREGITIVVVDGKEENELFRETLVKDNWNSGTSAKKEAPFLYEATKELAREYAEQNLLAPHKKWREWLIPFKEQFGNEDYDDNWMYWDISTLKSKTIDTRSVLGKEYRIVRDDCKHNICDKEWSRFYLIEKGSDTIEEICGYIFE